MLTNNQLLKVLGAAFSKYLEFGERSNQKLYVLHGAISRDLMERLGPGYSVQSLGVNDDREESVTGRYMDKKVDITISKNGKVLGGIAVKYVMSNYGQNSNNYFENMLGETANIRSGKKAYFQIFIVHKYMPYFKKDGTISKTEEIKPHHVAKYIRLSEDNIDSFMHTPTKTLFMLVDHKIKNPRIRTKDDFINFYSNPGNIDIGLATDNYSFGDTVVYNDYQSYIEKVVNYIKFMSN
ncbi:hypothetical protein [Candidatus Methanarcanum hacksteinii]|uniref:hypothetical protein n=1 Tax=Candidatus Methanarcanum hacksteinii TaxID=2911857 RepID=UPI0037DC8334